MGVDYFCCFQMHFQQQTSFTDQQNEQLQQLYNQQLQQRKVNWQAISQTLHKTQDQCRDQIKQLCMSGFEPQYDLTLEEAE